MATFLLMLAVGAGLLAAVGGGVTLEGGHTGMVKLRHRDVPWLIRRRAYAWFALAMVCWCPVLWVWLHAGR